MKVLIYISPKAGILDPQGLAVKNALVNLGFGGVDEVRVGKYLEIDLSGKDNPEAEIKKMCDELLYNPLVESYRFEIRED